MTGGTKCEERGRSDVMSQKRFLGGRGEKNPHHHRSYMLHAGPAELFFKVGGGGVKYLRSDRAKQLSWV